MRKTVNTVRDVEKMRSFSDRLNFLMFLSANSKVMATNAKNMRKRRGICPVMGLPLLCASVAQR